MTVEIENVVQLKEIIGLKFNRILFDNMSIKRLKKCLKICKNKYETEYSGSANLKNIKKFQALVLIEFQLVPSHTAQMLFDLSLELSS